jgi:hypothetical protein
MTQASDGEGAERPWLTLTEAASRTSRHIDAIRAMTRRGKLERRKGNAGQWLVRLPESVPESLARAGLVADSGNALGTVPPGMGGDSAMAEALSELREELADLRVALAEAKGEADAAKRIAAAEVEAMREQLDAGIAARDMVIAGLKDTVTYERARTELLESAERAHAADVAAIRKLAADLQKMLAEAQVAIEARRSWWRWPW